jgi:sulfide:quinone oxidoreductase
MEKQQPSPRTVLILGAGIGGTTVATRLRRLLPPEHHVIVAEREESRPYQSSLIWLLTGQRSRPGISRPLDRLAARGIELRRGEVNAIDPRNRRVSIAGRKLSADYLVIALGAELAPETVPGLATAGHNLYQAEGLEQLRAALSGLSSGRLAVLVAGVPFKCPAAPYEAALLMDAQLRRAGVRERIEIDIYTPEPGPMPSAGPEVSAQVRQTLEARGIRLHPGQRVQQVEAGGLHFADGARAAFDLLAYVPPHRAPTVVREAGLCADSGWVAVDRHSLETSFPGIYALGDVTAIPLAIGKPLPKAGVFAHRQGEVVAANIAADILGRPARQQFDGHGACFLEVGEGRAGFGSGNFYAEPQPQVRLRPPSRLYHLYKVAYEQYWLNRWF